MATNNGCCGSAIRFLLYLINGIFLIMGLVTFITAALLYWSDVLAELNLKELQEIVDIAKIDTIAVVLLVIGGFAIFLSLVGILGASCESRVFLVVYEILVVCMFLAHGITLLVLVFSTDTIETLYKNKLNKTVANMDNSTNPTNFKVQCDALLALSKSFECCGGYDGPTDFKSANYSLACCGRNKNDTTYQVGCASKSVDKLKSISVSYIVIPSGCILAVELFAIVAVPFLIRRIGNKGL